LVGPEGGFTDSEVEFIQNKVNGIPITLGSRILRTETAGIAVLSILMYELGEFGS
jgi:16S rRNA (uracil1498-N3)-methyltransferase